MLVAGLLMLIGAYIFGMGITVIVTPMILFFFGVTLIWPNAFAKALEPFGKIAGFAGSLYAFMQLAGGAVIGALVAHLPSHNQLPLAGIFIAAPIAAWLVFEFLVNRID